MDRLDDYQKAMAAATEEKNRRQTILLRQYTAALDALIKKLMNEDKLDEAKRVKAEKDKIAFELADLDTTTSVKAEDEMKPAVAAEAKVRPVRSKKWTLVIWNAHNSYFNDRATKKCNVSLWLGESNVWEKADVSVPWEANKDTKVSLDAVVEAFDRVRVDITEWGGEGGGLSEVQVIDLATRKNIALKCKTAVSGVLGNPAALGGEAVVDGITSSSEVLKGYWVGPNKEESWVEIFIPNEKGSAQLSAKRYGSK